MGMETRFLVQCRVARGFFEGEYLVIVAGSSAYVSKANVRPADDPAKGEVDGFVSAYVIETQGDRTLIELPGQPVVGGARTWIPAALVAANV
jgi:hypothetical protein